MNELKNIAKNVLVASTIGTAYGLLHSGSKYLAKKFIPEYANEWSKITAYTGAGLNLVIGLRNALQSLRESKSALSFIANLILPLSAYNLGWFLTHKITSNLQNRQKTKST